MVSPASLYREALSTPTWRSKWKWDTDFLREDALVFTVSFLSDMFCEMFVSSLPET